MDKLLAIGIALCLIVVVIVILQIVYIRITLSKFEHMYEYKQGLVRTADDVNYDRRFVVELYSVIPNSNLTNFLNMGVVAHVSQHISVPERQIPTIFKGKIVATSYQPKELFILALQNSVASKKLQHDVINGKVTYLVVGNKVYTVFAPDNLAEAIASYNNHAPSSALSPEILSASACLLLAPLPKYKDVEVHQEQENSGLQDDDWRLEIVSFMGATTGDFEDLKHLMRFDSTTTFHVLAYKV